MAYPSINDLVGQTVNTILVAEGENTMVFKTDQGDVILCAEGDCCSESWFADFTGVDTLLGQTITKLDEITMEDAYPTYNVNDGRGRQEEDQVYGYRFTTPRGYADLIFRNSSNGCYGGSLEIGNLFPGGKLTPVTADWSA